MWIKHSIGESDSPCRGFGPGRWFRCGACKRDCCHCFGGDSDLRSLVNLCDECWGHATAQAELEGIDMEAEATDARAAA
jgi:hypothetical protein